VAEHFYYRRGSALSLAIWRCRVLLTQAGNQPEKLDAATLGAEKTQVDAVVKDATLAAWLKNFPNTVSVSGGSSKVRIDISLGSWVMMHALHKHTKLWVEGNVSSAMKEREKAVAKRFDLFGGRGNSRSACQRSSIPICPFAVPLWADWACPRSASPSRRLQRLAVSRREISLFHDRQCDPDNPVRTPLCSPRGDGRWS
jgi:hypothetical protein